MHHRVNDSGDNAPRRRAGWRLVRRIVGLIGIAAVLHACHSPQGPADRFDLLVAGGTVYDGHGGPGRRVDVAISEDRIVAVGNFWKKSAKTVIDASGMVVAPGFINTLSWAQESLLRDGRGLSDLKQGVTLEIFGEGLSLGPVSDTMRIAMQASVPDIAIPDGLTSFADFMLWLESRGVAVNIASLVGATTIRQNVVGDAFRTLSPAELARMQDLVRESMRDGALGVGSALIYPPGSYATTEELIALAQVASEFGGVYASHLRSEGSELEAAVAELLTIADAANINAHIYHLKVSGSQDWHRMDAILDRVELERAMGKSITADIYPYTASATGMTALLPSWIKRGPEQDWIGKLAQPEIRQRLIAEANDPNVSDNRWLAIGAGNIVPVRFVKPELRQYAGLSVKDIAAARKAGEFETVLDLIMEDQSRIDTIYHSMSEVNLAKKLRKPWVAVESDERSYSEESPGTGNIAHPRAFGAFARILAKYVRRDGLLTLSDAIRRMTQLPATIFGLDRRGAIKVGHYADLVIFDPATIQDHATFNDPMRFASGVAHVIVNGELALVDGKSTGRRAGRFVKRRLKTESGGVL